MSIDVTAWLLTLGLYVLPLLHVALSPRGGAWSPPSGSACPFGPRAGWLVIVLLLGPLGWLFYAARRGRARRVPIAAAPPADRG